MTPKEKAAFEALMIAAQMVEDWWTGKIYNGPDVRKKMAEACMEALATAKRVMP